MKKILIYALILTYILTLTGCGKTQSSEELAYAAYSSLLSGDISLLDDEQISTWGLENWADYIQSDSLTYEYTYLDLDGDGINELLFQMENDPCGHNAVFHYADGRLVCWENDMVEATSGHYPLSDGAMVSQYDFIDNRSYTIFRYLPDGEWEVLFRLFMRESPTDEDSLERCPYYEINGTEVDQIIFEKQVEELITNRILPRSVWTTL